MRDGSSNVLVVRMDFERKILGADVDDCINEITTYGIVDDTSPLIPVCNTTSVSQFIFYSHKADERRPGTSESLIKASSSREGSKRPKTSPPKNINPLDTSTAIGPQQRTTNFVIGAFIWNWRRQTLVLATRSPDGSHNLLVHKPERTVQESARGWHPPGGFFNDRQKKVTLSVDQFDEKRLATEATRLGLIPTESQWKTIQNYDLERLIEIVLQLGAKGLISCCDLLKMVEDKLLLKLMVEQGEEDQKQGKRKKISEGNILSQIICRKLRLQVFSMQVIIENNDVISIVFDASNRGNTVSGLKRDSEKTKKRNDDESSRNVKLLRLPKSRRTKNVI